MGYFDRFKQKVLVNDKDYKTNPLGTTHIAFKTDMDVTLNERKAGQRKFKDVTEIELNQETNNVRLKLADTSVVHLNGQFSSIHAQSLPEQTIHPENIQAGFKPSFGSDNTST